MTWPGTHPDTEAGKPNTTDPAEPENHTPTKAATPTTGSPKQPPDDTTAGQNGTAASTKPSTSAAENEPEASTPQPESATPDTDSPPSADHDTDSENSSNTRENTDPSPSDASDANHKSATAELPPIPKPRGTWTGSITFGGGETWTCGPALKPNDQDYEDVDRLLTALWARTTEEPLSTALISINVELQEEMINGGGNHAMYAMARRVLIAAEKAGQDQHV